tara:strand:- start:1678 stop:2355 length:678 start_codon:yes stop_codon:yes gene_type:complete
MSDEHTIDTSEQKETGGIDSAGLADAIASAVREAVAPLYQQQDMMMQQRQQMNAPRQRQPTAADVGLDSDDPYANQFTTLIRELGGMKAENKNLRDQVHNLGVSTMQNQLGRDVNAALQAQNVPTPLHEAFSAVIYSVLQSGQQTTPEAVASNLMRGVNEYGDNVRKNVAEQAAMPKPPTFRGQELGPEMPTANTMEEAHEMFAELADAISQGASFEPLTTDAEG